jgi:hypothetical protein
MKHSKRILVVALGAVFLIAGCRKSEPTSPLPVNQNEAAAQKLAPKGNPKKPVVRTPE